MAKKIYYIPKGLEFEAFIAQQRDIDISYLISNMGLSHDDAEDVYQESSIALYQNIQNGKLKELTCALSTYLLQICKYQVTHMRRKNQNEFTQDDFSHVRADVENSGDNYNDDCINEVLDLIDDDDTDSYNEILDQTESIVQNLPEPCNTLIWGKFWKKFSHNELAKMMGYRSANVSKTQLSRCLDKFQDKVNQLMN